MVLFLKDSKIASMLLPIAMGSANVSPKKKMLIMNKYQRQFCLFRKELLTLKQILNISESRAFEIMFRRVSLSCRT